jgi:ATP-dependent Clp protease ATP-binding subunit ClpB
VVLLDEIEKAHHDVFNILLQVLDDGRLTDNHGHTVDFTNTLIVMTSNVGSQLIQKITAEGGSAEDIRQALEESLRTRFLPEFLNRIDETIVFQPLRREEVSKIVDLQLARLTVQLEQRSLGLVVTDAARNEIAARGYDPAYGARPVKRVIQQSVQNPLATELLKGEFPEGAVVEIDYLKGEGLIGEGDAGEFVFRQSLVPHKQSSAAGSESGLTRTTAS